MAEESKIKIVTLADVLKKARAKKAQGAKDGGK